MSEDRGEPGVRSVQLALDVLEAVAFSTEELGVTQIADRVRVTKGSVHRHLLTLVDRGYLTQNPETARYAIGAKSRLLARLAPDPDLVQVAVGPMRELRDRLGHSVVLSATTPRGALVMLTVAGTSPIEIGVRPGSELSFHASAQGKVLLAFAPRPMQQRVLGRSLQAFTARTIVDVDRVEEELTQTFKRGYAAAPERQCPVAAPVFDGSDSCVAAVCHRRINPVPAGTNERRYVGSTHSVWTGNIAQARARPRDKFQHARIALPAAKSQLGSH